MPKSEYILLFQEVEEVTRKLSDEQFGALMRAAFAYRFRGEVYTGSDIRVDQAFESIANQIDRDVKLREKKAKAGQLRWAQEESNAEQAEAPLSTTEHTQQSEAPYQSIPVQSSPVQSSQTENKNKKSSKTRTYPHGAAAPSHAHEKSFGKYSWVKLSLPEQEALERELGKEELERCIAYLDESAQMTGNKNRWKDWGTVIRRCSREGWGKPPGRDSSTGASGTLGEAELRNIRRIMETERSQPIYGVII